MQLNIVPARTGLNWARQGIRTFWKQPLALSGLFFLFMAVVSVVAIVPMVGGARALGLPPALTQGMIAAPHASCCTPASSACVSIAHTSASSPPAASTGSAV